MNTKNVLAILYRRTNADDENDEIEELDEESEDKIEKTTDNESKMRHCILTPLEIVDGYEIEVEGHKLFKPKNSGNSSLYMINDAKSKDDEFMYGFPIEVNEYTDKDKRELIRSMKNDKLYNLMLFQNFKEDVEGELETFTIDYLRNENVMFIIKADNYDETEALLEADIDKLKRDYANVERIILRTDPPEDAKVKEVEVKEIKAKGNNNHKEAPSIYANELYNEVKKYIICQDEQIKTIATILAKNQAIDNPDLKNNFILCGPTGVGKTAIFKRIAKSTKLPMVIEDATEFTAAGYKGKDVTSILSDLFFVAQGDLEAAQKGIIYIDEIDKKAGTDLDVTRSAVIQSLLKMIEGQVYTISIGDNREIRFDTSRNTFAFSGAFSGIEKLAKKGNTIGFGNKEEEITNEQLYNEETLTKYGLLPEFIGRSRIIAMNSLYAKEFAKILRESEISYLKLYRDLLAKREIEFIYDDKVIEAIAEKAEKTGTGARALKSIIEKALEVSEFYTLSSGYNKYKKLIITPKTIEDNRRFILK